MLLLQLLTITIILLLQFDHRRAPSGSAILGAILGLFGDHLVWSDVDHIASHPRTESSSSPQPIPLGEAGLRRFCETGGGGGDKRSVCNLEFTHVTHIVK